MAILHATLPLHQLFADRDAEESGNVPELIATKFHSRIDFVNSLHVVRVGDIAKLRSYTDT